MKNKFNFSIGTLFTLSGALLPIGISYGALDKFEPYAYSRLVYESNIFRFSNDQEALAALGNTNKDDRLWYLGAGFKSDYKLSRQHLLLDLDLNRVNYDTFGQLDNTSVYGKAVWKWQLGNLWDGHLGYEYLKEMSTFTEFTLPLKDMKTKNTGFLDAGYQIHPDWRLEGGFAVSDTSYDIQNELDRDLNSTKLEVQYKNTLNTRVGLRARYANNDLKDTIVGGTPENNDYDETEYSAVFYWESSGKSALEARLGYTDLSYDQSSSNNRDFQGTSGRLTYSWEISGKTNMEFELWRETDPQSDEIASYVVAEGFRIAPSWAVTPKITLGGEIYYVTDDFKGDAPIGGVRRDDETWLYRIAATWTPRNFLSLSLGYTEEERDSNINTSDFTNRKIDAGVTVSF